MRTIRLMLSIKRLAGGYRNIENFKKAFSVCLEAQKYMVKY